jgi:hypothetical protein
MSKVLDMSGKPMIEHETPEPMQKTCENILNEFFAATVALHQACNHPEMKNVSFRDDAGKVYSAAAVMRLAERHLKFIRIHLGAEYKPSNHNTIQPRR